jgi:hypothetical protein
MKTKKTKRPQRRSELDRIVTQLRTILRRRTSDIVKVGNLLIKARKLFANEHGEWLAWLAENFDLSPRTAQRYVAAAEYVQKRHVSHFANLSASVLYRLAEGQFDERVEAAILAEACKRRVGEDAMWAICEKLAPADDDDDDDADDADDGDGQDDGSDDGGDVEEAPDLESKAILDGPPPAVPPPAPNPPPTDFALRDFDQAISALKRLMTKPSAQFTCTIHTVNDLENVESFMRAVTKAKAAAASVDPETPPVRGQRRA